ncbi:MAG: phytanoyl-CoA dioxygenase family protein [Bacteroidota bacterium]|nr:phytanoyl-CoA dioxygenase family protein [Bacteroidota bacterium]MDP4211704.1 phytanoyl-CoA dioxygenase family protein [Bacteroidota bacterium]MDP4250487.1 phytanoyl-CoA dioxygenase family protein [Bacteroidota bacterium]
MIMETRDLSKVHQLIGDLFPRPEQIKDWDQYKLSSEQLEHFEEFGYVSNIKLLDDRQISVLLRELGELTDVNHPGNSLFYEFSTNESADPSKVLFHALGAWRITPGFHDVLWNPRFLMPASQLLGNKAVRFWHDQLFCKPARHGGVVAWHQDYSYWIRSVPMQHLTCWCGLDDADISNGCLYYVPGSHRWGLLEKPELAGDMDGLLGSLTEEQKSRFKPVPIPLKAGYASFHHPLLVHGSYANTTERQRRAFVINVFADGTRSNANEPMLNGTVQFNKGEKLEGDFYPLLFDPRQAGARLPV